MKQKYWIWVSHLSQVSYNSLQKLIEHFKTPENIWNAKKKDLDKVLFDSQKTLEFILDQRDKINLDREFERLNKLEIEIVTVFDEDYPYILKQIPMPPYVLYFKGKYLKEDSLALAIVGTRHCTSYGKMAVLRLTQDIVSYGFTVASGLAYGIDAFAHETALNENGRTIAVLGTGLDLIYPKENKLLSEKIIERGALISEFPLGTEPLKYNFPRRNRIISGLSLGTLVIEGSIKSGAMITASYALEQNREVFAVPGPINSIRSEGPNCLIKEGAKLVLNAQDIVNEFSINIVKKSKSKIKNMLLAEEKQLVDFLADGPKTIDQISEKLNIELTNLALLLVELESKNIIEAIGGGKYACLLGFNT